MMNVLVNFKNGEREYVLYDIQAIRILKALLRDQKDWTSAQFIIVNEEKK